MGKRILSALIVICLLFAGTTSIRAKSAIRCKSVVIDAENVVLSVGDIATLSAVMKPANSTEKLEWTSSNNNAATVNKYGTVTGVAPGTATVTVKTSGGQEAKCSVSVQESLTREEVEALIREGIASDETIAEYVAANMLTKEDVQKLIAESVLTEEDVKRIVKENSLTEADVRAIAGGAPESWTGSQPVSLIPGQTLPMQITDTNHSGIIGKIKDITVTKQHVASSFLYEGTMVYLPYKYDVMLTVDLLAMTDAQKASYRLGIVLGSPNVAARLDTARNNLAVNYGANSLMQMVTLYSAYDVDEFFIESAFWEDVANP